MSMSMCVHVPVPVTVTVYRTVESPRNGGHVSPSKNRGLGTILREDSFDRQKYSYKMTYK